ncbi:ATAD3 [Symbiodinium microadriaticum]|nr:ATAD3 [Symbiodinium microadriaticum]
MNPIPPKLRSSSLQRWSWRPQLSWLPGRGTSTNLFEKIVLEEALSERLQWSTNALLSAQQNGTPFRHLLLHGPPGTGKTLFARTLARQSGLDYAIMSGGDLGPLGRDGPNELHKLFEWAKRSRRGLVLFIDEADSFLRRGRGGEGTMGEDARNSLSVFLHHTGTESARVAVILATNVPTVLDRAVLDRVDEEFEFPRPAFEQRNQMLRLFIDQYLLRSSKGGKSLIEVDAALDDKFWEDWVIWDTCPGPCDLIASNDSKDVCLWIEFVSSFKVLLAPESIRALTPDPIQEVLQPVHHSEPATDISEEEGAAIVAEQEASWIEHNIGSGWHGDDLQPQMPAGLTRVVHLTLSRSHRRLDEDLEHSVVLQPYRQALEEEGLAWRLQPSGAKIFMEPFCFRAIYSHLSTMRLRPCDIFVSETLENEVVRVIRQIPRSLGVIPRSSQSIAFADEDGEVVLVSRSFLNIPAGMFLSPASVVQSTTEDVAKQTEGMSGRQLAKLVLAFQPLGPKSPREESRQKAYLRSAVFGSGTTRLTQGLAQTVLQWRLSHPNACSVSFDRRMLLDFDTPFPRDSESWGIIF